MPVIYKKSKGGSSSSKAGRGRGRPSFVSPSAISATDISGNSIIPSEGVTSEFENAEKHQEIVGDDQVVKDEPAAVDANDPEPQFVKITHTHPLMGLWEGSFNVKSATGMFVLFFFTISSYAVVNMFR